MPQGDWLYDNSANKFNNTYFRNYNNSGFAVDMSGDLVVRGKIRNDDTGAVDVSGDLVVRGSMEIEKPNDSASYGAGTQIMNFKTYYPPAYDKGTIKSAIISGVSEQTTQRTDNGYLAFSTADAGTLNERMRIEKNGNVGIGTSSPAYALDVNGSSSTFSANTRYFNSSRSSLDLVGATIHSISIRASGGIYSSGSIIASDRRIKTNISEINDSSSLDKIRLLKPSYYNYIDTTDRTSSVVEGFIAQEVKEVLPYAVSTHTSYIPNIFKIGSYNEVDKIITIEGYDTNTLEYDASNILFKKIKLYDVSNNEYVCEINEIVTSNQIRVQSSKDIPIDIFVYGQEVDNFNALKKESIFTVGISALQEVDRQLQAEKVKTATLESQVTALLTRVTALENA